MAGSGATADKRRGRRLCRRWLGGTFAAVVLALLVLAGCAAPDATQVRICARLIPALEAPGATIDVGSGAADPTAANAVRLPYEIRGAAPAARWISCRFAGSGLEADRLRLTGAVTDRGPLSDVRVFLLREYWLGRYEGQARRAAATAGRESARGALLYALQLVLNGLTIGGLYGLLAIGYTLVYGIVGRINLAFGEVAIAGAYTTFLAVLALALLGVSALPLALLLVLAITAAVGAAHGLATERLVFRPLRGAPSQAPLVATLGLAIFLQEALRLLQGAEERWLPPLLSATHEVGEVQGFALTISSSQVLAFASAGVLFGALWLVMHRSRFGRCVRACADDLAMAELCGVDVGRTIAAVFGIAAAYAAIAGMIVLVRYGGVGFHEGFLLGFKALTAAIVGGIGSVTGAMLGGLAIGLVEVLWAGYLRAAYRDVAIFGLLAATLIWRPQGFLGQPVRLTNERLGHRPV